MLSTTAVRLEPGTRVFEVEYGLRGRFVAAHQDGNVLEVDHTYDGGGFDYWPAATTVVVNNAVLS